MSLAQSATALVTTFCQGSASVCQRVFAPQVAGWGSLRTGASVTDGIFALSNWPPADPVLGTAPANGFFDPSQYAADCGGPYFIINSPTTTVTQFEAGQGLVPVTFPAVVTPICSATAVPVVDTSFLSQLQSAGLQYKIVYPIQDNGNGRGYVVWNNAFPFNYNFHRGSNYPTTAGYARITGLTWQNQFAPTSSGSFGDPAGAFINGLPSPIRQTTLRLEVPGEAGVSIVAPTMVTDAWLAGTVPPAPQVPPVLAAPDTGAPPPPINVGGQGVPFGAAPAGVDFGARNVVPFDVINACETGVSGGTPRSASWIAVCIANAQ